MYKYLVWIFFSTAGTAHSTFLLLGQKNKWSRCRYTSPVFFHVQEQEQEQEQEEQQERRRSILSILDMRRHVYSLRRFAQALTLTQRNLSSLLLVSLTLIKDGRSTRLKLKATGRGEHYYYLLSTTRRRWGLVIGVDSSKLHERHIWIP